MPDSVLFSPKQIQDLISTGDAVFIDVRDRKDFEAGHLPGAVNMPDIFTYLAETTEEGLKTLQDKFADLFSSYGLDGKKTAIIYEDALHTRYGGSCRGYWILNYLGYPKVGILDGGLMAWKQAGGTLTTQTTTPEKTVFPISIQSNLMATYQDVLTALTDPAIHLLDNRDKVEWLGESSSPYGVDFAPRKGRIPGAVWIEWYDFMKISDGQASFRFCEEILALAASRGLTPEDDIIIYCFKGARAANTYVALSQAGFKKLRIYMGSWNEWSRNTALPIEDGLPKAAARLLKA
ncbi:sulfurtransferase [Acetobacter orleanensis]|uniref:Thiosulfate sulfurtransferase n=1 Tax=Acetobacter orleanensis TaxID=104099 RepID=A0A4Y3TN54_9PROT|nr:sulfurtransferase [Acetobacter orleanensis]KXV62683.1 thiosulfate sulfurtransferase [Acetobacter orleanensis]PCD79197.1 sulfurtransferase [Acetobacter orleanensis]GAN68607.1 thiosulfate sulfurtransferase [Acetobacter orleanensis JCM 7639]GBR27709.1 thiosulfate sulfurtransferase [Acetobacter orleanensis NRIC 0473]GEB83238.1 thiosulfate sulfurtransferase [Acetobacter orleanensis]